MRYKDMNFNLICVEFDEGEIVRPRSRALDLPYEEFRVIKTDTPEVFNMVLIEGKYGLVAVPARYLEPVPPLVPPLEGVASGWSGGSKSGEGDAERWDYIPILKAGTCLGIARAPWMGDDYYVSWSPRNLFPIAEGSWREWVALARAILKEKMEEMNNTRGDKIDDQR